jgi:BASS family bile acid:Na+ symporter
MPAPPILKALLATLTAAYLVAVMLGLGIQLGGAPKEEREQKRTKRAVLARALLLDLVLLPALAAGAMRALGASSDVAVALLLLICAPGGRFGPQLAKLGRGDLSIAVELTLLLAKLTSFTAPFAAKWALSLDSLKVREWSFVAQLILLQLVPFYTGKWLRRRHPTWAERLVRPANAIWIASMLALLAIVLFRESRGVLHLLTDRGWAVAISVAVATPVLHWTAGGKDAAARRALAVMGNAREIGLALVMANIAFPTGNVRTALFGLWSMFLGASALLAWALGARPRTRGAARAAARQSA